MTAREVIEQIKKLPHEEQEKVLDFVAQELQLKTMGKDNFEQAATRVFERHRELMRRLSQ